MSTIGALHSLTHICDLGSALSHECSNGDLAYRACLDVQDEMTGRVRQGL